MNTEDSPSTVKPLLVVIHGPAGCGKSTLCDRLVSEDPTFKRVITATTRPMRDGEVNSKDYHFLTREEFQKKIDQGEFIEYATVHGELYGVLKESILEPLRQGQDLVMNIDFQGVRSLQKEAVTNDLLLRALCTVFVRIDIEEVEKRLISRGKETLKKIAQRIETAKIELAQEDTNDYSFTSLNDKDEDYAILDNIIWDVRFEGRSRSQRQN